MKSLKIILSVLPFFLASTSFAAEHEVQMLNKGSDGGRMVFEPAFVVAEPRGYLITFVSVDKGNNCESMAVPDGAEGWKGKNQQRHVGHGPSRPVSMLSNARQISVWA